MGGVEIPHDRGLDGHSDADVVAHAVMDALLGAAALGDIGVYFPADDMRYKDICSMLLLTEVGKILADNRYAVCNIDVTIIAQEPKLSRYIPNMRRTIADALSIGDDCVGIKATTEEGMGFTGERIGIACHAVCLINIVKENKVYAGDSVGIKSYQNL